jgi:hypothetical protein
MAKDILDSKSALIDMVTCDDWEAASSGADKARGLKTTVMNETFFSDLKLLVQLVQPVSDAIHQLEANKPLLSQVKPVMEALEQHSKRFEEQHTNRRGVHDAFKERFDKHKHPADLAAWYLDPTNMGQDAMGWWGPPWEKLSVDEKAELEKYLKYMAGPDPAAQDEIIKELRSIRDEGYHEKLAEYGPVMTEVDPETGKQKAHSVKKRMAFWAKSAIAFYPRLAEAALKLLSMHATTAASERNWSIWTSLYTRTRSNLAIKRAEMLIFIKMNGGQPSLVADLEKIELETIEALPEADA